MTFFMALSPLLFVLVGILFLKKTAMKVAPLALVYVDACNMLGLNPITVFAGQNAGGSLGNMICPNNVVAACATVDIIGREGEVLRKGIVVFGILLLEYMVLAMIYTHILFPNFGM